MSRDWRLANALMTLHSQVNLLAPHRRTDSDGGIGNAEHAARTSDHNPYIVVNGVGVVRAFDFTHAPETGFDAYAFAETLLHNRDSRVRYVISNWKIANGKSGAAPWQWRPYHGANPHDHHTHVSVTENEREFDDPLKWRVDGFDEQVVAHAPEANVFVPPPPTLRVGSRGLLVKTMQTRIGMPVAQRDGWFGENETLPALRAFQRAHGLDDDGKCGPQTWKVVNDIVPA